jgi:hypothetical protein
MSFVHHVNVPVAQATMDPVTIFNIIKRKQKISHCLLEAPCICVSGIDVAYLHDLSFVFWKPSWYLC